MIRRSLIIASLLAPSCSPPGEGNESAARPGGPEPVAVVTAASGSGGACSYFWNQDAITEEGIVELGIGAIEQAIEDVGGVENLTDQNMPFVRLEAAPDTPYSCTGPALRQLERVGFVSVLLPAGASAQRAHFFIAPPSDGPFAVVRIMTGGMSWDGGPIDRAGLRERVRAAGRTAPKVELVIAPAGESSFMALHDTLSAIGQEVMKAILSGCAGTTGPVRIADPVC